MSKQVDEMIEGLLNEGSLQALETDDPDAFLAGAEWAARRVLRLLSTAVMEMAEPYLAEMSE